MAPAPPPIETRRGLPLALGQHATPALDKLARECLRPDDLQIAALLVSRREPVNLEHFAIAVGERLPDEEFARAKALERVQARLDEVRRVLDRRTLCLEMDVIIDRYDFDRERFVFGSDVATLIMADPTGHADSQRQRLELEHGLTIDASTPWPVAIAAKLPASTLDVSRHDAERINDALIPASETSTPKQDPSRPLADVTSKLTVLTRLAIKSQPEALLAWSDGGGFAPNTRRAPEADAKSDGVAAQLAAFFAHGADRRRARAYVFFTTAMAVATTESAALFEGGSVQALSIEPIHVVMTDAEGRAFGVSSPAPTAPMTHVDMSSGRVEQLVRDSCRGRVRRRVKTVREGGALVDRVSLTCRKCPRDSSSPGDAPSQVDRVLEGSFLAPGSHDTVVMAFGCEPMSNGGGGGVLMTRGARAVQTRVAWIPDMFDRCVAVPIGETRDRIVCPSIGESGGDVSGGLVEYELLGSGVAHRRALAPIEDSRGSCREGEQVVAAPAELVVDASARRLTATYEVGSVTFGPDSDCEPLAEEIERVDLVFESDGRELVLAPGSASALARIEALTGGAR